MWSACHQRAFDRTEETTHGHQRGERVPGEITKGACPASLPRKPVGRAGQALGSVGPCPPEWTHRNEALAEDIEVTAWSSPNLSLQPLPHHHQQQNLQDVLSPRLL